MGPERTNPSRLRFIVRRPNRLLRESEIVNGKLDVPAGREFVSDALLAWLRDDRDHQLEDLNRFQVYVSDTGNMRIEPYGD